MTDGVRTIAYSGTLFADSTLVFDGPAGKALLDGADVTHMLTGDFPLITPPETTISIVSAPFGELAGTATVSFHDRWW